MLPPVHQKFHCKEHNHVISDLLSKVDLMEVTALISAFSYREKSVAIGCFCLVLLIVSTTIFLVIAKQPIGQYACNIYYVL